MISSSYGWQYGYMRIFTSLGVNSFPHQPHMVELNNNNYIVQYCEFPKPSLLSAIHPEAHISNLCLYYYHHIFSPFFLFFVCVSFSAIAVVQIEMRYHCDERERISLLLRQSAQKWMEINQFREQSQTEVRFYTLYTGYTFIYSTWKLISIPNAMQLRIRITPIKQIESENWLINCCCCCCSCCSWFGIESIHSNRIELFYFSIQFLWTTSRYIIHKVMVCSAFIFPNCMRNNKLENYEPNELFR